MYAWNERLTDVHNQNSNDMLSKSLNCDSLSYGKGIIEITGLQNFEMGIIITFENISGCLYSVQFCHPILRAKSAAHTFASTSKWAKLDNVIWENQI